MKKIVPFLSSALMCAMCFADIVIDEGKEYVIPDSGEVTISEKLTGKGAVRYTGGGTLILTNGGNDFSGGLYIDDGRCGAGERRRQSGVGHCHGQGRIRHALP